MNALVLLLAAEVGSSTTSTTTATATVAASTEVELSQPMFDPLGDQILYVGTPLLLPDPPPPPPRPAEPPPPALEPLPPPVGPPLPLPGETPPPIVEEKPPASTVETPMIERLRSIDGVVLTTAIVLLMVVAGLLSSFVRRRNDRRSHLSRLASSFNKLLRIAATLLLLLLAIGWLPSEALPFALLAVALALGWSMRDVLPDLIAGAVLSFERRLRPGMWLSGEGFAGVVERVGLRATWLRDATDRRVAVPNRVLVSNPVTSDDGHFPTREVIIRIEPRATAEVVRRAIIDAVLASPWTPVSEMPSVQRDGSDPAVWHVRARVLDLSFAGQFEGELLERAEAMLVHRERDAAGDRA